MWLAARGVRQSLLDGSTLSRGSCGTGCIPETKPFTCLRQYSPTGAHALFPWPLLVVLPFNVAHPCGHMLVTNSSTDSRNNFPAEGAEDPHVARVHGIVAIWSSNIICGTWLFLLACFVWCLERSRRQRRTLLFYARFVWSSNHNVAS